MSGPTRNLALLVALLAAAGVRAAGAGNALPERFTITSLTDTLKADEEGSWLLEMKLTNAGDYGVYGDSLLLRTTPLDAGASGTSRTVRLMLPPEATNISSGTEVYTQFGLAASADRARLEVFFHAHTMTGGPFVATLAAEARGSVFDGRYPPSLLRAAGRQVEIVKVPADSPRGAGVLLLPGEGSDAKSMLVSAARLAREGASAVIVNAPGQGRSQGPDDFVGPAERAAALAALDTLKAMPGVNPANLGVWGRSRGGSLALLLAATSPPPFRAVVAQSACYDLWSAYRSAPAPVRAAMEKAGGRDAAGWRSRSPLTGAVDIRTPVLVHHGALDDVCPVATAQAFADSVQARGRVVETRIMPRGTHDLPAAEAVRFLRNRLLPSR